MNEPVGDAAQVAQRYNCRLRVVVRDGRTVATGNPEPRVIDAEVRDGRIARVIAVGQVDSPSARTAAPAGLQPPRS